MQTGARSNPSLLSSIQNQEVPSLSIVVTTGNPRHTCDNAPALVKFLPYLYRILIWNSTRTNHRGTIWAADTCQCSWTLKEVCHTAQTRFWTCWIITPDHGISFQARGHWVRGRIYSIRRWCVPFNLVPLTASNKEVSTLISHCIFVIRTSRMPIKPWDI